jgi:hypothetical protein
VLVPSQIRVSWNGLEKSNSSRTHSIKMRESCESTRLAGSVASMAGGGSELDHLSRE